MSRTKPINAAEELEDPTQHFFD